jgi:hypothetical protein
VVRAVCRDARGDSPFLSISKMLSARSEDAPSPSCSTTTSHMNALRVIFCPEAWSVDRVELFKSIALGGGAGGGGNGEAERCRLG